MRPFIFDSMTHLVDTFVARLSGAPVGVQTTNHYASYEERPVLSQANAIRRHNLRRYLRQMFAARPRALLVGEAPGYRGCRLTGIPFTSEAIILDRQVWRFGHDAGYRKTDEREAVTKEATATMIWSALSRASRPPLLWNAYPFHPFQAGKPLSNRKPSKPELQQGANILAELLNGFAIEVVGAVGRSAAIALDLAGVCDYLLLRHPSHGGKTAFETGLQQLLSLDRKPR